MTKPKYRDPPAPSGSGRVLSGQKTRPQDSPERRLDLLETMVQHLTGEVRRLWEERGGPPSKKGGKR